MDGKVRKTAYLGMFTVMALIFSYVEVLIPFDFGIPGIKLGLANIVTLTVLYIYGFKESFTVLICRILLAGMLFGNMYGILYSLAGGIVSIIFMYIFKKIHVFSMISVSLVGGVMHNIGQLVLASFIVLEIKVFMYGPVLIISGLVTGLIVGIISKSIISILEKHFPDISA